LLLMKLKQSMFWRKLPCGHMAAGITWVPIVQSGIDASSITGLPFGSACGAQVILVCNTSLALRYAAYARRKLGLLGSVFEAASSYSCRITAMAALYSWNPAVIRSRAVRSPG